MKSIKQTYEINASVDKVWDALVNPKTIDKWGGGPVKMSEKQGFKFELWGGDIYGRNKDVIKNKKLVQEWFSGKWEKPSIVTFLLNSSNNKTTVELIHTDIPDNEANDIRQGWKDYYMIPLKQLVESL